MIVVYVVLGFLLVELKFVVVVSECWELEVEGLCYWFEGWFLGFFGVLKGINVIGKGVGRMLVLSGFVVGDFK